MSFRSLFLYLYTHSDTIFFSAYKLFSINFLKKINIFSFSILSFMFMTKNDHKLKYISYNIIQPHHLLLHLYRRIFYKILYLERYDCRFLFILNTLFTIISFHILKTSRPTCTYNRKSILSIQLKNSKRNFHNFKRNPYFKFMYFVF